MHKLGIGIIAAAATLSIAAFAQSGNGAGAICNANQNFGAPHDICVACLPAIEGDAPPSPVCQCKAFEYFDPYDFYSEFKNQGQCVSFVTQGGEI